MAEQDLTEVLSGLTLFSDLTRPQLEATAQAFEEVWFGEGRRILRQGFAQPDFHVILDGEAVINVNGEERSRLARGDFFGEVSALLGDPPTADVVAATPLRCVVLTGEELRRLLFTYPRIMYRMLQGEARRLRGAIQWRT